MKNDNKKPTLHPTQLDPTQFDTTVPCRSTPVTRRELLGRGLLTGVTYVTLPSFVSNLMTMSSAQAEPNGWTFVQINCAGGPSIHGNFLPRLPDGNYPADITKSGVANSIKSISGGISTAYGAPFLNRTTDGSPVISRMAAGMQTVFEGGAPGGPSDISTLINARIQSACVVTTSQNDTGDNPQAIGEALIKAGAKAEVAGIVGRTNTSTGIRQKSVMATSTMRSLFAGSIVDIQNATKFTKALSLLPADGIRAMANAMTKLTESQLKGLNRLTDSETIREVASKTLAKNSDFLDPNRFQVDARQVLLYQRLFNIPPPVNGAGGTAVNNNEAVIASVVKGAMDGHFAAVGFDVGTCDYHGQLLTMTEAKDEEIGMRIGQVLRAAFESNRKCFIFVSSDGSNYGSADPLEGRRWNSADVGRELTTWQLFIMDPTASAANPRRRLLQSIPQIGMLAENYISHERNPIKDVRKAAAAVVLNAINLMNGGNTSRFDELFPGMFTREQKSGLLLWAPTI